MPHLRSVALALALPLLAGDAFADAPPPPPAQPTTINIVMTDYQYDPKTIELTHGQSYILHLTNQARFRQHGFEAKEFFATVTYLPWSEGRVKNGDVEVGAGGWNDIAFTPNTPGTYPVHSPDPTNELMGMKGTIVVR